jgi:hypothetical protein
MAAAARSLVDEVALLLVRDLHTVRREVAAYADDAEPWRMLPGLPNCGGSLVLHLCGNLRHFVGGVLGQSGYVRDRDAEFSRRDVPRAELDALLETTIGEVQRALAAVSDEGLHATFPVAVGGHQVPTRLFLLHLVAHLTYHLGQIDAHRRVITGNVRSVDALAIAPLA